MKQEQQELIEAVRRILPMLNRIWPIFGDRTLLNKLTEAFIKATSPDNDSQNKTG